MLLTVVAKADYVEYWVSGMTHTVVVNGVVQPTKYTDYGSAVAAAFTASQQCKCVPIIRTGDVKVSTKVIKTSSGSSSSSSSKASSSQSSQAQSSLAPQVLTITAKLKRMNGDSMLLSDLGGYELWVNETKLTILASEDPVTYTLPMRVKATDTLKIAAFDTQKRYSDFIPVQIL